MPKITIGLGFILIALGVVAWLGSAMSSWTALIPSILGAILASCGAIGLRRPKLGVHLALVVALLGIAGTLMNVMQLGDVFAGTAERPLAVIVSTITFALLIAYVALGVRSFIAARRSRGQSAPAEG